ncbi:unnamed protein product [Caenorhabditis nigoni]
MRETFCRSHLKITLIVKSYQNRSPCQPGSLTWDILHTSWRQRRDPTPRRRCPFTRPGNNPAILDRLLGCSTIDPKSVYQERPTFLSKWIGNTDTILGDKGPTSDSKQKLWKFRGYHWTELSLISRCLKDTSAPTNEPHQIAHFAPGVP